MSQSHAKTLVNLRIEPAKLALIDSQAARLGMSRTEYMTRCALGESLTKNDVEDRLSSLEERFSRLEELAYNN